MEWLQANWLPLLIVTLVVLAFIGWIVYLCKKKGLREIALKAILEAEKQYNTTTGKERLAIAVDYMYNHLPSVVKAFLSEDMLKVIIERFVQKIFDEIKEALDYQKVEIKEGE